MKKTFIALFILVAFVGIVNNPVVVFGQEDPDALLAISDDETLTEEERFNKAKDGLILALTLAKEKVAELTTSLDEREFDEESRESELKASFLAELQGYDAYYSEKLEIAEPFLTLEEVQALALEVKTYRDETYTPKVEEIVQFILVFYSEDVIAVATERFNQISEDIDTLESLGLIKDGSFDEQLGSIDSLLNESRELTATAKEALLRDPAEEELGDTVLEETLEIVEEPVADASTSTEVSDTQEETAEEVMEEEIVDPLEISLGNVKAVYEVFLEISKSVKETLGID